MQSRRWGRLRCSISLQPGLPKHRQFPIPLPSPVLISWRCALAGRCREATNAAAEAEAQAALGQFRLIVPLKVVEALRQLIPGFPY